MNHPLFSMEIRFENDIVSVRQRARRISALPDFDELEQARVATAVSEIARNALNHAQGGRRDRDDVTVVVARDAPPGGPR